MRSIRRRVFIGCQGESERSYATLLHRLIHQTGKLHIDPVLLDPGAGDPLDAVKRAILLCKNRTSDFGEYKARAVLLDHDQMGLCPKRDSQVRPLALKHGMTLVWQRPCHEGFLLRHFPECRSHKPTNAKDAMIRLKRCWPEYEKASSADRLGKKLDYATIRGACEVEPELNGFLDKIGFFR